MKQTILFLLAFALYSTTSCHENTHAGMSPEEASSDIILKIVKDSSGDVLEMSFNNMDETVTLKFNSQTIVLVDQEPASGIWYTNEHYELRGKGSHVELKKDGKSIFKN